MLYLTCTTITSGDLAHYGISRAQDWVSVDCGTSQNRVRTEVIFIQSKKVFKALTEQWKRALGTDKK